MSDNQLEHTSAFGKSIQLEFATELKRLAHAVSKDLRLGNELAALSSLTALLPLIKTLSADLFESVSNNSGEMDSSQPVDVETAHQIFQGYL